jgi:hypothetical protein
VAAGVISRLIAHNLIEAVPEKLGRFLSISLNIHTSGEVFVEKFLDNTIFETLRKELFLGRPGLTLGRVGKCLCKQRIGVISIREQLLEGKYWSGTEPKVFSMGLI